MQIDAEKRALDIKPLDVTETQEYKILKQKLEDLQNHLRAKQKISQLQAMKVRNNYINIMKKLFVIVYTFGRIVTFGTPL